MLIFKSDDGEVVCRSGYTVLHELAVQGLEANIEKEDFDARNRIIALALKAPGIWSKCHKNIDCT